MRKMKRAKRRRMTLISWLKMKRRMKWIV